MSELPNFSSKAFLAPMAGVSDPALRFMCKKMGAGLVVTELTSVNAIVAKQRELESQMKDITEFIEFSEKERPLSVQLFGSDIVQLEHAAKQQILMEKERLREQETKRRKREKEERGEEKKEKDENSLLNYEYDEDDDGVDWEV